MIKILSTLLLLISTGCGKSAYVDEPIEQLTLTPTPTPTPTQSPTVIQRPTPTPQPTVQRGKYK